MNVNLKVVFIVWDLSENVWERTQHNNNYYQYPILIIIEIFKLLQISVTRNPIHMNGESDLIRPRKEEAVDILNDSG